MSHECNGVTGAIHKGNKDTVIKHVNDRHSSMKHVDNEDLVVKHTGNAMHNGNQVGNECSAVKHVNNKRVAVIYVD